MFIYDVANSLEWYSTLVTAERWYQKFSHKVFTKSIAVCRRGFWKKLQVVYAM